MGVYENFEKASKINKEDELKLNEKHLLLSKEKLKKVANTKMRTTFIGSLSAIEKFFSELWEYDYQDGEEVSKRKRVWKEKWEQCRAEILNNGNNQLRAVDAEIDQYSVSWDGYTRNFSKGGQS
jgi:hypothetical protein